jgi:hypothetical protein
LVRKPHGRVRKRWEDNFGLEIRELQETRLGQNPIAHCGIESVESPGSVTTMLIHTYYIAFDVTMILVILTRGSPCKKYLEAK